MVKYIDKIVESKSNGVSQVEKESVDKINNLVYSLYGLTEEDIELIKSTTI